MLMVAIQYPEGGHISGGDLSAVLYFLGVNSVLRHT